MRKACEPQRSHLEQTNDEFFFLVYEMNYFRKRLS